MSTLKTLFILVTALIIVGCVSTSIREMNQALNQAYMGKMQILNTANNSAQTDQLSLQNSLLTLSAIAKESAALANQAQDNKNSIVFHRIAATAAWQSEQLSTAKFASTGQQQCMALNDDNDKVEMAAHCAMLALLPVYAMVDGYQARYNALLKVRSQSNELDDEQVVQFNQSATALLDSYAQALDAALTQRGRFELANLSESFLRQADQKLGFIACQAMPKTNLLRIKWRPQVEAAECAIREKQRQLATSIALPQTCIDDLAINLDHCD